MSMKETSNDFSMKNVQVRSALLKNKEGKVIAHYNTSRISRKRDGITKGDGECTILECDESRKKAHEEQTHLLHLKIPLMNPHTGEQTYTLELHCTSSSAQDKNLVDRKILRDLIDSSSDLFWIVGFKGEILYLNKAAQALLRNPQTGEVPGNISEIPMRDEEVHHLINRIKEQGYLKNMEVHIPSPEGTILTFWLNAVLCYDSSGRTIGIMGSARELTGLPEPVSRIHFLEQALRCTNLGVTITDQDGNILYINEAEAHMHGYRIEEVLGKKSSIFGVRASPEPSQKILLWERESWNRHRDGTIFPVELISNIVLDENGQEIGSITFCQDITTKKELESQVYLLSQIVEKTMTPIIITDHDARITYVNPAFTRVTGYCKDEVIGQNPRILKGGTRSRESYEEMWSQLTAGQTWHGEFINKRKNGELYHALATITPIVDENNEVRYYVSIQQDITERKQIEEVLKEHNQQLEELLRLKDEFLALTSHDFRSLLNAIVLYGELVRISCSRLCTSQKSQNYLGHLLEGTEMLRQFVMAIFDTYSFETGKLTMTYKRVGLLKHLARLTALLEGMAQARGVTLRLHHDVPGSLIIIDAEKMGRVYFNLVNNALKYTPPGGVIDVKYRETESSVIFSVLDEGPGIPSDDLERVFEKYYRSKDKAQGRYGLGLGLYISRLFVQEHKGTIKVENLPDKGCRFTVEIPRFSGPERLSDLFVIVVLSPTIMEASRLFKVLEEREVRYEIARTEDEFLELVSLVVPDGLFIDTSWAIPMNKDLHDTLLQLHRAGTRFIGVDWEGAGDVGSPSWPFDEFITGPLTDFEVYTSLWNILKERAVLSWREAR